MPRRPGFLALIRIESVTRIFFLLLLASLLMVADGYVLILVSRVVGIYLLLAAEAATGLAAVVVLLTSYRHTIERIRKSIRGGEYPAADFRYLACLWVGAILLILPGFVTDLLGVAVLIPPLRWLVGRWIERSAGDIFEQIAEHVRVEE